MLVQNMSNTPLPPTLRLGNTADRIATVQRNTATLVTHVTLARPVIERVAKTSVVIVKLKPKVAGRRSKRHNRP
jgi:hypothetical protein